MRFAAHGLAFGNMHHAGSAGPGTAIVRDFDTMSEGTVEQDIARADTERAAPYRDIPEIAHEFTPESDALLWPA
jgi:hypothetical protein